MPMIGIDFGNSTCYIAKTGIVDTVVNEYDLRSTPSCVAFLQRNRLIGVAAKNQMVMNLKNSVFGFKRLLGRKFSDPFIQKELDYLPYKVGPTRDGGVGIRVHYRGEDHVYSPEQITAMLFTKLKESATTALGAAVDSCVISVPSYFTNAARQALLDAATIAGLNVLKLFNETTATALTYGFYKEDLPAPEEKSRKVVFVDMGHTSLQVSACAFNKGKLKVLGIAGDAYCGGRDIDMALATYFCQEFVHKMDIDVRKNYRAGLRLLEEAERLKKDMSVNSASLMLNIENFMRDMDVSSKIQRSQMEKICYDIFILLETTLRRVLSNAGLSPEDIHSVEIVGGSTRIPAVKAMIEQVFGKQASTTLNTDESVARGCALKCELLSSICRGREFAVVDLQPYSVSLSWDNLAGATELFPVFNAAPSTKILTFDRQESFTVTVHYSGSDKGLSHFDKLIGQWHIRDVQPTSEGDPQKVKLKVRINNHGIITIEKEECIDDKNKQRRNRKEWRIDAETHGLSEKVLKNYIEIEVQHQMRSFGAKPGNSLERELDDINNWLDLEGDHQDQKAFDEKLSQLVIKAENFFATSDLSSNSERGVKRQMSSERFYGFNRDYSDQPTRNIFSERKSPNNAQQSSIDENRKRIKYCNELRELNRSALERMSKEVDKNPTCVLTSHFRQYENHLKEITDRRIEKN